MIKIIITFIILNFIINIYSLEHNIFENEFNKALDTISKYCNINNKLNHTFNYFNKDSITLMSVSTYTIKQKINNKTWYVPQWLYNDTDIVININEHFKFTQNDRPRNREYHAKTVFMHELLHVMGINLLNTQFRIGFYCDTPNTTFFNCEHLYYYDVEIDKDNFHLANPKSIMSSSACFNVKNDVLGNDVISILNTFGWNCTDLGHKYDKRANWCNGSSIIYPSLYQYFIILILFIYHFR